MANRRFNQFFYSFHKRPVMLTCKYTVLATNPAGVTPFISGGGGFSGPSSQTSFGQGIAQVLGNSSAAAAGNVCVAGNGAIQLQDNYSAFLGMTATMLSPVSGSNVNVTTGLGVGTLYQITAVGTTTAAGWLALGVPAGVTPAVGLTFQAITATVGSGTGTVKVFASSNLTSVEVAGDPNGGLAPVGQAVGFNGGAGGWIYLNYWKTAALQQPTDGTIVELNLFLSGP